jgi:outer membrane protein assembly factor BamB
MGGTTGSVNFNDVWRSIDNGATWTQMSAAGWSARFIHSSVVLPGDSIIVMGGYAGSPKNDVWQLTTVGSSEQNPSHTYTVPGRYNVMLTAWNTGGSNTSTKTNYITVDYIPPVANFTASVTSGATPLFVRFTDFSTDYPTNWSWDFGDGATSTLQNPTHVYLANGTYTVNLTATNPSGSGTVSKTDYITVMAGSGTGGLANSSWPKFQLNSNNTGQSSYAGPQLGTLLWTYATGGAIQYAGPSIGQDGTIYVGSTDNNVYALNSNGSLKWSYTTGNKIYGSPVISADGTIYTGSYDGKLYALNPDGTPKWNYTTGARIYGSPAIGPDGTIYVGSYDKNLYALNPDGTLKWRYTAGNYFYYTTPAIGPDGTVYIGNYDSNLYAFNPDGTLKWSYTTGGRIYGAPAIGSDGTIYIGSYDKKFYAINPDGTLKWSYTTGNYIYGSPAIGSDGTVYVGNHDSNLYAFNSDGTLKWNYTTGGRIYGAPAIGSDGTIYVGSYDKNVYAINPDGTLKWSYTTGNYIYGSPAIGSDGTLYIGSNDQKLYAFQDLAPVADFTSDVRPGPVPMTVTFTDTSANSPASWLWDFGDGDSTNATLQNPVHTYTTAGNFTVKLTATNAVGSDDKIKTDYVVVSEITTPVADFTTSTTSGVAPLFVRFTDTSANYPTSWLWDFGDGSVSTDRNTTHTYMTGGPIPSS